MLSPPHSCLSPVGELRICPSQSEDSWSIEPLWFSFSSSGELPWSPVITGQCKKIPLVGTGGAQPGSIRSFLNTPAECVVVVVV